MTRTFRIPIRRRIAAFWLLAVLIGPATALAQPAETPEQRDQRLKWWRDARFGMFIHWGPVSLKGTEIGWSRGAQVPVEEYDRLYLQFNPTRFDADAWARTARSAGMKYMVFTTKHHDGFCMFDTKLTDFNVMRSPFGRDVVKELAEACRKQGLVFGTYHSVCDWHHPDFPRTSPGGTVRRPVSNIDRYDQYIKGQVAELVRNYGPLGIMWFDVPQEFGGERGRRLLEHTRALQPSIIVNNRSGAPGDYDTPEQRVGAYQDHRPWETCMTICRQWAWKPGDEMKSLEECLGTLVLCAGGDGNLLFNVGPTPEGLIEPRQVDRLERMGAWLERHGESIYGTRGGPWKPSASIASTRAGKTVFVHVLKWGDGPVRLPDLPRKVVSAALLGGDGAAVAVRQDGTTLEFDVPASARQPIDTVVRLELDGSAMDLKPISLTAPAGKAAASNVFQGEVESFGPEMAFDGNPDTRWATDAGTRSAWVEIELTRPRTVGKVRVVEAFPGRVRRFELKYRDGREWKVLHAGTTLGEHFEKSVGPVVASGIRLEVLEASEGPTISEIEPLEK